MTNFDADILFDDASAFDSPPLFAETFPTVTLYWSPTTGPLEVPSWEPFPTITVAGQRRGRVRAQDGITTRRGRSDELGPFEAGTMSLTVDNRDRLLDPLNTASDWYGSIRPNIPVQLRATWDATEYVVYTGLVDGWPQVQHGSQNDLVCELDCTDLSKVFARRGFRPDRPFTLNEQDGNASRLGVGNRLADKKPELPNQFSGARVRDLLERAGVDESLMDVDGGDTRVKYDIPTDDTMWVYIDRLARTEGGKFFVTRSGKVAFWARHHTANPTSAATFADTPTSTYRYADLVIDPVDMSLVRNEIRRGTNEDTTVTRRSSSSIRKHGISPDEQTDLLYASATEGRYAAEWVLARYGQPRPRVKRLTILPQRSPSTLFPFVLDCAIGTRFTVTSQPMDTGGTFSQVVEVESVSHQITAGAWVTEIECSVADTTQYFQLNTATYGRLDAGNKLNY
jgi:hypothetical protein